MTPTERNHLLNVATMRAMDAHFPDELARSHLRYEILRKLSAQQIVELNAAALMRSRPFDELVDDLVAEEEARA